MTVWRILWVDHHGSSDSAWWSKKEIVERASDKWLITTTGEIVYEDADCVTLAPEQGPSADGDKGGIRYRKWTTIMKALIQSRVELQEKGP